jgi:hypothetical protein
MDLVAYLDREWMVISNAPFTFISGTLLVAAASYAVLRVQFEDRLRSLEARIALRDDRIAEYERKLDGNSPGVAKFGPEELEPRSVRAVCEMEGAHR